MSSWPTWMCLALWNSPTQPLGAGGSWGGFLQKESTKQKRKILPPQRSTWCSEQSSSAPLIAHQCLQTPQPQPCLRHLLPGHPTLGEVAGQCCLCPSASIQRSAVTQPRAEAEESHPQQLAAASQHVSQTLEYNPTKQELQCKCRQRNLQQVKPTVSHCPAAWAAACHSCTFAASYQPWRSAVLSGAEGCGRTQLLPFISPFGGTPKHQQAVKATLTPVMKC